ncbi:hypothetical protein [Nocardia nepalensis]|uniref:hypothetical protein n=1 Tax=Nocardia nepalensis TaxID=3375448 RepID=UPI003B67F620
MSDEQQGVGPQDERAMLGKLLSANAELVVGALRPEEGRPSAPVLPALTATRNLSRLVDDILHTLARQAREQGHTWAEIGDLLGTSRQAAFQRFSGPMPPMGPFPQPPTPPTPPNPPTLPGFPTPPGIPMPPTPPGPPAPPGFATPPMRPRWPMTQPAPSQWQAPSSANQIGTQGVPQADEAPGAPDDAIGRP